MKDAANFAAHLLAWYRINAAPLAWRSAQPNPYHVWLSEMMLQQTQIETVKPYYAAFLAAYPTVQALAAAPLDDVLKLWEGLGYYARARNLHRAAQIVSEQYGGDFPNNAQTLQTLPGIGRYTAGAIASIAFGERAPVLDGNVIRVFSRLYDLPDDVSENSVQARLWDIAEALLPPQHVGDYNQALMELGQTHCRPKSPSCSTCPVQAHCLSFERGTQLERPHKKRKPPTPHYDVAAGMIWDKDGRVLIAQRPNDGLLGGLWEFPGGKQEPNETLQACLMRELHEELGVQVEVGELFARVKHAFTHFKITLHAFSCVLTPDSPPPQSIGVQAFEWVYPQELKRFSFGKADREVIAQLDERNTMLF